MVGSLILDIPADLLTRDNFLHCTHTKKFIISKYHLALSFSASLYNFLKFLHEALENPQIEFGHSVCWLSLTEMY